MADIYCPHCKAPLSQEEVAALWGRFRSGRRTLRRGPKRKISPTDRASIKILAKRYPQTMLADHFGVSRSLISKILKGKR